MKVYTEMRLRDFEPWGGACSVFDNITNEELDMIEETLEDIYPEGMSETAINDFFWFENDTIAQGLSYADYDEMLEDRKDMML